MKQFLGNDTRAAGTQLFYNSLVKSRWNLAMYWSGELEGDHSLSNDEFIAVAENEAVLYPLGLLIKIVQTDDFGSLPYSFPLMFRIFVTYAVQEVWWVADVDRRHNVNESDRWHAGARFTKRTFQGVPINPPSPRLTSVSFVRKTRGTMKKESLKLIKRIEKEFYEYGRPTNNQLLAMGCNPLTGTIGMIELGVQTFVLNSKSNNPQSKALQRISGNCR